MIQTWRVTSTQNIKLQLDASSLDIITRQLPEGYYSTFRTFDRCTRVLGLTAHLQRLYEPVPTPEVSVSLLRRQLRALLEAYRPPFGAGARRGETADEARVRAIMTKHGQAYITIEPLKKLPSEIYEKGVHVETTELQREHPRLKSTTFIGRSDSEKRHIAREGIFEALLMKNGKILEGMTSNFFYVVRRDATSYSKGIPLYICTARDDILLGITRNTVIELARGRGLEVKYQALKRDQLMVVSEAFITSSSRGIVPVIQIDDVTIGQGRRGPITKQLSEAYDTYVIEKAERI